MQSDPITEGEGREGKGGEGNEEGEMSHGVRWLYAYSLFKLSFAKVTQQVPQVFLGACLQSLTSPRHGPSALASPSSASGRKDCTLPTFVAKRVTQFLKSQQNILK